MGLVSKLVALLPLSFSVPTTFGLQGPACLQDNSCSGILDPATEEDAEIEEEAMAVQMGVTLLQRKLDKPNDLGAEAKVAKIDSSGVSFMHDSSSSAEQQGRSGEAHIDSLGETQTFSASALTAQTNAATSHTNTSAPCGEHPSLCNEPLACHGALNEEEIRSWHKKIATDDGKPNLRLWCHSDFAVLADSLVQECLVNKDPLKSAHAVFEAQKANGATEADASYCFWEKHCNNEDVTSRTSMSEARNACDRKYGRESWESVSMKEMAILLRTFPNADNQSFSGPELPNAFGRLSCAMGSFHCDVVYCQQTYCRMPNYIERYGHLLNRKT